MAQQMHHTGKKNVSIDLRIEIDRLYKLCVKSNVELWFHKIEISAEY